MSKPTKRDVDDQFARDLDRKYEDLISNQTNLSQSIFQPQEEDCHRLNSAMEILELLEQIKPDPPGLHDALVETGIPGATRTDQANEAKCHQPEIESVIPKLEQLDRFRIIEQIGRGGFGIVVRAYDPQLERDVAIKIPRFESALSPDSRARFVREAKAAAALNHPGVVAVHESGCDQGIDFIVTELVDGENLATLLARGQVFSTKTTASMLVQLADAVEHAHQRGVLHRDIKPANILIKNASEAAPKISDFGLASMVDSDDFTQTGAVVGTPAFMSPEQAAGKKSAIGPATDVYGLGAVLYQLLTGNSPFGDRPLVETLRAIAREDPQSPRNFNATIPRDLEAICLKCLEKNPAARYSSAVELQADLQRFLDGQPVSARPVTRWKRIQRWSHRNPILAFVGSVAVLFLMLAAITSTWGWLSTSRALQRERAAKAERNAAINEYFTEVADNDLLDVPGLTPLRHKLLGLALAHYQGFLDENSDDSDLLEEIEQAHFRLARTVNLLGRPAEALVGFQRAIDIQNDQLNDAAENRTILARKMKTLRHIADVQIQLGQFDDAMSNIDLAIVGQRRLSESGKGDLTLAEQLAQSLTLKGLLYKEKGEFEPAKEILDEAIGIRLLLTTLAPDDPASQRQLAETWVVFANATAQAGDVVESAALLDKAIATHRDLFDSQDRSQKDRVGLTSALYNRATKSFAQGQFSVARPFLEEAVELNTPLVVMYPDVVNYQQQQATIANGLGFCYSRLNMSDEALDAFRTNTAALEHLLRLSPDDQGNKELLAIAMLNLGSTLGQHDNDFENAIGFLQESNKLFDEILINNPQQFRSRIGVGNCEINLAANFNGAKQFATALEHADRSINILKGLNEEKPNHPQIAGNLPRAFHNRASALEHLLRFEESITSWEAVVDLSDPRELSSAKLRLAAAMAKAGNAEQAQALLQGVIDTSMNQQENAFQIGRVRALVARDWVRSGDVAQEEIDRMSKQAVESLEQARQQGKFMNPSAQDDLRTANEFDLLRKRSDFKQLLAQVLQSIPR